jgi:polyribonucleotide nucleotidyltransferase
MEVIKREIKFKTKKLVINDKKEVVEISDIEKTIEFEFGELAKQASGSVKVTCGGTSVLCCVVTKQDENKEIYEEDVVPLTVDYRERNYAAGKIPGGFFKREGKPRDHEIHISRLIDRTLRPLFLKETNRDIQITSLVLSFDLENDPSILAVLGCSAALMISEIPFLGPVTCFRLGKINDDYILNPTFQELDLLEYDFVVSFKDDKVLMIELEAKEVLEKEILNAIEYLRKFIKEFVDVQNELKILSGKQKIEYNRYYNLENLVKENFNVVKDKIVEIIKISDKKKKDVEYKNLLELIKISDKNISQDILNDKEKIDKLKEKVLFTIFRDVARNEIVERSFRPDGRNVDELREIKCKVGVLPRTHGSALFQRGQTQALATVTLGTSSDMQIMDDLTGEYKEGFLFHYNFPGFATGEVRPERGVSRRELGHGMLARKSLHPMLPTEEEFPYAIRVVSDILESNGSSSMASVCGGSLALFDAGVNLKSAVAGVAIGLVHNEDKYIILTDIAGLEDHIGDMDFKIAGTKNGITAIQLDLKIHGIDLDIISESLERAKKARLKILDIMNSVISSPRKNVSKYAPKVKLIQIPQEKIGGLIGPGGKNIKQIIEQTQTKIDIDETGKIFISAENEEMLNNAIEQIEMHTKDIEEGKIYKGKVVKIAEYGAFVELLPGKTGLLHISQVAEGRVQDINSVLKEGDEIYVKVLEVSSDGKYSLSRKQAIKEGYK